MWSTKRYHCIPIRMTKILKKTDTIKYWQGYGAIRNCLHCWQEYKMVQPLWEWAWRFLTKLNIYLLYDPELHPGIYPREKYTSSKRLYKNVHNSFIYNSQKLEIA